MRAQTKPYSPIFSCAQKRRLLLPVEAIAHADFEVAAGRRQLEGLLELIVAENVIHLAGPPARFDVLDMLSYEPAGSSDRRNRLSCRFAS